MTLKINYLDSQKKALKNKALFVSKESKISDFKGILDDKTNQKILNFIKTNKKTQKNKIDSLTLEFDQKIIVILITGKTSSQEAEKLGAKFYDFVKINKIDDVLILGSISSSIKNKIKLDEFLHGAELKSYEFNLYKTKKNKKEININILKSKNNINQKVKSKLDAYKAITASKWSNKVVTLFPTMVLGGGDNAPYSHISQGLLDIRKHLKWARWFHLNGAFHFLHAEDIAKMVAISMTQDVPSDIVMGNPKITFNDAILEMAEYIGKKPWVQLNIPQWVINALVFIFKRRMDTWGAHCAKHPYFEYDVHAPYHFGEEISFSSLTSVLKSMENK